MKKIIIVLLLLPAFAFTQSTENANKALTQKLFYDNVFYKGASVETEKKWAVSGDADLVAISYMLMGYIDDDVEAFKKSIHSSRQVDAYVLDQYVKHKNLLLKRTPSFDISGYDMVYNYCVTYNENLKKKNDSAYNVEHDAYVTEQKKLSVIADSVKRQELLEKHQRDSIETEKYVSATNAFRKECVKKFGKNIGNHVADGYIDLGYTKEMCEYAWGQYDSISKTKVGANVIETWGYYDFRFVTFKNGIVVSIDQ